jgi:hypothetical protein
MTDKLMEAYARQVFGTINESKQAAEKAVHKLDRDAYHVGSHGSQHAFAAGETDRGESDHYMVHDTATGKTHHVHIEHGGEPMSHAEVMKAAGKNIHPSVVKAIHKDHKEEMGMNEQVRGQTGVSLSEGYTALTHEGEHITHFTDAKSKNDVHRAIVNHLVKNHGFSEKKAKEAHNEVSHDSDPDFLAPAKEHPDYKKGHHTQSTTVGEFAKKHARMVNNAWGGDKK